MPDVDSIGTGIFWVYHRELSNNMEMLEKFPVNSGREARAVNISNQRYRTLQYRV